MSDINIHGIPDAPGGYSYTGKKVMVHDPVAPLGSSTVLVDATDFSSGGGGTGYAAPMWKESDGDMTAGFTTFTNASLVGATEINFIIVNKVVEFIDEDYTFDQITGTIDRSPNTWASGDKMVTPYKPA
jgi:hypothetical protein